MKKESWRDSFFISLLPSGPQSAALIALVWFSLPLVHTTCADQSQPLAALLTFPYELALL